VRFELSPQSGRVVTWNCTWMPARGLLNPGVSISHGLPPAPEVPFDAPAAPSRAGIRSLSRDLSTVGCRTLSCPQSISPPNHGHGPVCRAIEPPRPQDSSRSGCTTAIGVMLRGPPHCRRGAFPSVLCSPSWRRILRKWKRPFDLVASQDSNKHQNACPPPVDRAPLALEEQVDGGGIIG
jgi:hypothetical protein